MVSEQKSALAGGAYSGSGDLERRKCSDDLLLVSQGNHKDEAPGRLCDVVKKIVSQQGEKW